MYLKQGNRWVCISISPLASLSHLKPNNSGEVSKDLDACQILKCQYNIMSWFDEVLVPDENSIAKFRKLLKNLGKTVSNV